MPQSTTNKVTNEIIEFLLRNKIFAWRSNSTGVFDTNRGIYRPSPKTGVPDIIAILPPDGTFLGIEIKTGKDRLRPAQEAFHATVRQMGGYVVTASCLDQFQGHLKMVMDNIMLR